MNLDDDPLGDIERDGLDEPMTPAGRILIGALIVVEVAWMLTAGLIRALRRGVFLAFQDVKH